MRTAYSREPLGFLWKRPNYAHGEKRMGTRIKFRCETRLRLRRSPGRTAELQGLAWFRGRAVLTRNGVLGYVPGYKTRAISAHIWTFAPRIVAAAALRIA
jgi:hypothetical protein